VLGLALLIGATILIPVRWFVKLGGRDPIWELRRTKTEVSLLANKVRLGKGGVAVSRLEETSRRLRALRSPSTGELCDLMQAQLDDLIAGGESWNEAGRRSIRIDELSRRVWPADMPPLEVEAEEATFRWRLYRHFGRMMELGSEERTPESLRDYRVLLSMIDEYRRPDTFRFIDAVHQSADRWLASPVDGTPWIAGYDFQALGPQGQGEVRKLWRRDASFWGAHLDEEDIHAINEDLARRAEATSVAAPVAPERDVSGEPVASRGPGELDEPDESHRPGEPKPDDTASRRSI